MLFPTREANERAGALQHKSFSEGYESQTDASPHAVAIATVHARQDLVLVYSLLVDCHRQSVKISRGVWALVVVGTLLLLKP